MLKNSGNHGTEEIGFLTPIPGRVPAYVWSDVDFVHRHNK